MILSSVRITVRIFFYFLLFCALLITLLVFLVSQLDLDSYSQTLQEQLSDALGQPVQIGHSSLTFHKGLALKFERLLIGTQASPIARIPKITATLELPPLLERKINFDQVQLDDPQFRITFPVAEGIPRGTSHRILNSLGIDILTIHNASLQVSYRRDEEVIKRLDVIQVNAVLRDWHPQTTGKLVVTGHLNEPQADFLLETSLPGSIDPEIWRQEEHRARLEIRHISTAGLPKFPNQDYPETLDLDLTVDGTANRGIQFESTVKSTASDENFFALTGVWTSSGGRDSITDLQGTLLGIPLQGHLNLARDHEQKHLSGQLGIKGLALDTELLKKWRIPNAGKFKSGHLKQLSISWEKSWSSDQQLKQLPRINAKLSLNNLEWDIDELKQFHDFSANLQLEKNILQVENGLFDIGDHSIRFSGSIHHPFLQPELDLEFLSQPDFELIGQQLSLPREIQLNGTPEVVLTLKGSTSRPLFRLAATLTDTEIEASPYFVKNGTQTARFVAFGQIEPQKLTFEQAQLSLQESTLTGAGLLLLDEEQPQIELELQPVEVFQLKPFSEVLNDLEVTGRVAAKLKWDESGPYGQVRMEAFGAHLTSVIGDLRDTTGILSFTPGGLSFKNLSAGLGESRFQVDGRLNSWQDPQLTLDVSAQNIRPNDLIFFNRTLKLHDLKGHLVINRKGIQFDPVSVQLEEETEATVTGQVNNFTDPEVTLDIQADRVNVLDVISLFQGPHKAYRPLSDPVRMKPVKIKVAAKEGTLGGLRFQNAEGQIVDDGRLFVLSPLSFQNGDGWCHSRVEFDRDGDMSELRVSGHAEDISAEVLHKDIFSRQGLIKGRLKGDFYVQGDMTGDSFWASAQGGMHLQVEQGTLHKFHSLSKVFSLLNISQLFAGRLPDMDKDGMPFNLLEGSIKIASGRLATEDLKINSEAMNLSLIGSQGIEDGSLDFTLGVMPLRTVDKVITSIPVAGWVLTGEDKALLTAYFKIEGTSENPEVSAVPVSSVSNTVLGIFKRTLGLPGKIVRDIGDLFKQDSEKKEEP